MFFKNVKLDVLDNFTLFLAYDLWLNELNRLSLLIKLDMTMKQDTMLNLDMKQMLHISGARARRKCQSLSMCI